MTAGVGLRSAGARAAANPLRSSGEALARLASGAERKTPHDERRAGRARAARISPGSSETASQVRMARGADAPDAPPIRPEERLVMAVGAALPGLIQRVIEGGASAAARRMAVASA